MADATPVVIPITDASVTGARIYFGVTTPLMALCLALTAVRISRKRKSARGFAWDDWLIIFGVALTMVDWILLSFEMVLTAGSIPFPKATNAIMLAYWAIHVWCWAMTSIKVSVALMLLGIKDSIRWRYFLYPIIGLQVTYMVGNTIWLLNLCRPLSAWWDHSTPNSTCVSDADAALASNVSSAINITTDILLSLSPILFLWKLNRPLGERVMLCVLMALGLLTTLSSIMKLVTVQTFNTNYSDDIWALAISIALWTVLECMIAILAACGPFLKPFVERALDMVGIRISRGSDSATQPRDGWRDIFRIPNIESTPDKERSDARETGSSATESRTAAALECRAPVCETAVVDADARATPKDGWVDESVSERSSEKAV